MDDLTSAAYETPAPAEDGADRRAFPRVPVNLPGRYMLEDGGEHACVCIDVSIGGARLRAAHAGPWGSRVIAYIDGLGRLEGHVVRRSPGWFAIETRGAALKNERLRERILLLQGMRPGSDRRRQPRGRDYREASLVIADGGRFGAVITDVSREGAAILTEADIAVGDPVRLDSRRARVVRVFPGGAALDFEAVESVREPRRRVRAV